MWNLFLNFHYFIVFFFIVTIISELITILVCTGDQPEAYCDSCGEEGVQLPAPEGQPDRLRHRVHRRAPARQEERLGHHGLPQVSQCVFTTAFLIGILSANVAVGL